MLEQTNSAIRAATNTLGLMIQSRANMFNPIVAPFRRRLIESVSSEAATVLEVGNRFSSDFRVLGRAPLPNHPVSLEHWWLVPIEQDTSPIPDRAYQRVQAIYQAGLRPKGFVIAHEIPQFLPAPKTEIKPPKPLLEPAQLLSRPVLLTAGAVVFLVLFGPLLLKLLVTLVMGILTVNLHP